MRQFGTMWHLSLQRAAALQPVWRMPPEQLDKVLAPEVPKDGRPQWRSSPLPKLVCRRLIRSSIDLNLRSPNTSCPSCKPESLWMAKRLVHSLPGMQLNSSTCRPQAERDTWSQQRCKCMSPE